MDVIENFMPGRTFKLVYYGNLILWGLVVMFLVLFIILELVKDNSRPQKPTAMSDSNEQLVPDMKEILLWGYQGRGVKINVTRLFPGHLEELEEGFLKYNLNKYLSDRMSMRRPLPDVRDEACRQMNYDLAYLPSVSVVVAFRNEPRTTLLRMLYSVIDRSPMEVLDEIILVDDGTEIEDLQYPRLEHYLSSLKKVSILRLTTPLGAAQARMQGAREASGDVVVFLQPRCECTEGWLAPLLLAIATDYSTVAVPLVDTIDSDTFQYNPVALPDVMVGSFTWELVASKRALARSLENATLNTFTPVITDSIFALTRDNLFKLGGFDDSLTVDEIVNIEFSFRSWLCGSQIVLVPCSHVGYITPRAPAHQPGIFSQTRLRDSARVADRWMGSYGSFVHERLPSPKEERHSRTRETLPKDNASCQSFDWFMQNLEPARAFPEEIQRRGRLVLVDPHNRLLSLEVRDGNVIVENFVSGPPTIWYLLKSGAIATENRTCLSYVLGDNMTEQSLETKSDSLDSNKNVLETPTFVRQQHIENQFKETPIVRLQQEQWTSKPPFGILFQREPKRYPQPLKTKPSPQQRKSNYANKNSILKYDGQNGANVRTSRQNEQVVVREPRVRSRSLLNSVPLFADESRPLPRASVRQSNLHNGSESDRTIPKPESEPVLVDTLVMKPCVSEAEADGDRWSYTEVKALQHQISGLCLTAQRESSDNHLLRLTKCLSHSQAQQWTFASSLMFL